MLTRMADQWLTLAKAGRAEKLAGIIVNKVYFSEHLSPSPLPSTREKVRKGTVSIRGQ